MQREVIVPENEQEWLALRRKDITSTMSPALFNVSPYMTAFELYHAKASGFDVEFPENERMTWGKRLEPVIAAGIAEDNGWELRKITEYVRLPHLNMGSSFDYEVICPYRGKGILEVKNVDGYVHYKQWVDGEAPPHIEIQLQHQLEVKGDCKWGVIGAFVGGNKPTLYERAYDPDMGAGIRRTIATFWKNVAEKNEPKADFYRDGHVIRALYQGREDLADKTKDDNFAALVSQYNRAKEMRTFHEREEGAAQVAIIKALGNHAGAYTQGHKVEVSTIKESQGTLITSDMVGTYTGGRKAHNRLYVKDLGSKDGRQSE